MLLDPSVRCRMHLLDARALLMQQMMGKWGTSAEVSAESDAAVPLLVDRHHPKVTSEASQQSQKKSGAEILRDQDVLQDWTALSDVLADKAWHERLAEFDTSKHTVEHSARLTGRNYMTKRIDASQLQRAIEKHQYVWTDERPGTACDLEQLVAASRAQGETQRQEPFPWNDVNVTAIFAHLQPAPLPAHPQTDRPKRRLQEVGEPAVASAEAPKARGRGRGRAQGRKRGRGR